METITIRVDETLFQQLEGRRGDKSKSDFYRELISDYLNTDKGEFFDVAVHVEKIDSLESQVNELKADLSQKTVMNEINSERIKDLQKQLGWMQLEYQKLSNRLLLPAPKKKWWRFWK